MICHSPWWRHQMEIFSASLALCVGNSPVIGEFPAHRPVTRSFDVFFDLRLNKRLNKQSWGWWSETSSCPLWRHCNVLVKTTTQLYDLPHAMAKVKSCLLKQKKKDFIFIHNNYKWAHKLWLDNFHINHMRDMDHWLWGSGTVKWD